MLSTLLIVKQISELLDGKRDRISISEAQIVDCNLSLSKAKKTLSPMEFQKIKNKFDMYAKLKEKHTINLGEYLQRTLDIIEDFESISPYYNLTEDDRTYRIAIAEKNDLKKAQTIMAAGINFLNSILSDKEICPDMGLIENENLSELVFMTIAGHYRAVLSIFNYNGLVSDTVCSKSMWKLDSYIQSHYCQEISNDKFEFYFEAELGEYNMSCRTQNMMVDMFKRMMYFALMPLSLEIDIDKWEEDPCVLKLWEYEMQFQKAICGSYYRYLKLA